MNKVLKSIVSVLSGGFFVLFGVYLFYGTLVPYDIFVLAFIAIYLFIPSIYLIVRGSLRFNFFIYVLYAFSCICILFSYYQIYFKESHDFYYITLLFLFSAILCFYLSSIILFGVSKKEDKEQQEEEEEKEDNTDAEGAAGKVKKKAKKLWKVIAAYVSSIFIVINLFSFFEPESLTIEQVTDVPSSIRIVTSGFTKTTDNTDLIQSLIKDFENYTGDTLGFVGSFNYLVAKGKHSPNTSIELRIQVSAEEGIFHILKIYIYTEELVYMDVIGRNRYYRIKLSEETFSLVKDILKSE